MKLKRSKEVFSTKFYKKGKLKKTFKNINNVIEKYLPFLTVSSFILGIVVTWKWESIGMGVQSGMNSFINGYGKLAPMAIFLILAPSLGRMLSMGRSNGGKFLALGMLSFSGQRLLACIWGVIFTGAILGLPLFSKNEANLSESILITLKSLGNMMLVSPYFYAVYLSIITVIISLRVKFIANILQKCASAIEIVGQSFVPLVPFFMFAIGSYIYSLPSGLKEQLGGEAVSHGLSVFSIFGFSFSTATPLGMIGLYLIGAGLTGIGCLLWHSGLLIFTKIRVREFSIKKYFTKYWTRVYPLLWSSSSEALATPLNLYLVKKYYNKIKPEVRRFVIGMGSFASINGTMICVFVLAGVVAKGIGYQMTTWDLFLCIPLVFLIGFGVPGIPGELLLFGGPMVVLLKIGEPVSTIFLTLYLGLQIGLPDSFRTGNNSTDNCLTSIRLNKIYERKFYEEKVGDFVDEQLAAVQK